MWGGQVAHEAPSEPAAPSTHGGGGFLPPLPPPPQHNVMSSMGLCQGKDAPSLMLGFTSPMSPIPPCAAVGNTALRCSIPSLQHGVGFYRTLRHWLRQLEDITGMGSSRVLGVPHNLRYQAGIQLHAGAWSEFQNVLLHSMGHPIPGGAPSLLGHPEIPLWPGLCHQPAPNPPRAAEGSAPGWVEVES